MPSLSNIMMTVYVTFVGTWLLVLASNRPRLSIGQWFSTLLDAAVLGLIALFIGMGVWAAYTLELEFFGLGRLSIWCSLAIVAAWAIVNLRASGKSTEVQKTVDPSCQRSSAPEGR